MKRFINLIFGTIIIITTIIFSIINWGNFDEIIPVHFSVSGNANGWANKQTALLLIPFGFLVGHIIMCLSFAFAKEKCPLVFSVLFQLIFPIINILYETIILSEAYDYEINVFFITMIFLSVIFIIIGSCLPRIDSAAPILIRILSCSFFLSGIIIFIFTVINKRNTALLILYLLIIISIVLGIIIFMKTKFHHKSED